MVPTKAGSLNNPWLEHLQRCAAEYHQRRAAEHASSAAEHRAAASATDTPAKEKPVRRRVVGKRAEAAATAPPRAKAKSKQITEKDHKKLAKTVKEEGRKRAKKKAAEAAKKS